jgi:hypothetical protein
MAEVLIPSLISPQAAYPLIQHQLLSHILILLRTSQSYAFVLSIAIMSLQYRKDGTPKFTAQISQKTSYTKFTCGH